MSALLAKWPRTYHLPISPGLQNDDRRHPDLGIFENTQIAITEKMDGEGATMTRALTYPRSPDGRYHPSRDMMKAFHAERAHLIPDDWRISGEYMYARHSVPYTIQNQNPLKSWFYGFGVWDEQNRLLPWDETLDVFEMIDVVGATELYRGSWDEEAIAKVVEAIDPARQEGFVLRSTDAIPYPEGKGGAGRFFRKVAKWVRKGHVQTDEHWSFRWRDEPEYRNELAI